MLNTWIERLLFVIFCRKGRCFSIVFITNTTLLRLFVVNILIWHGLRMGCNLEKSSEAENFLSFISSLQAISTLVTFIGETVELAWLCISGSLSVCTSTSSCLLASPTDFIPKFQDRHYLFGSIVKGMVWGYSRGTHIVKI